MIILTHRGIDQSKKKYFSESSYEAFRNQVARGYGLELDINFSKDKKIFFFHDKGLERISNGQDKRLFNKLTLKEIKDIRINGNRLCDFSKMMGIIKRGQKTLYALHLKSDFQKKEYLDIFLENLKKYPLQIKKIIVFDVKLRTAEYLKRKMPNLTLAPSVAHDYDIKRFDDFVGGTLISLKKALNNKKLLDYVWLDEWDKKNSKNKVKKLYTEDNFRILRKNKFKICLVTPELHAASPALLGNEFHPDGSSIKRLSARIKEIIALRPDAICTDHPELVKRLLQ